MVNPSCLTRGNREGNRPILDAADLTDDTQWAGAFRGWARGPRTLIFNQKCLKPPGGLFPTATTSKAVPWTTIRDLRYRLGGVSNPTEDVGKTARSVSPTTEGMSSS